MYLFELKTQNLQMVPKCGAEIKSGSQSSSPAEEEVGRERRRGVGDLFRRHPLFSALDIHS